MPPPLVDVVPEGAPVLSHHLGIVELQAAPVRHYEQWDALYDWVGVAP